MTAANITMSATDRFYLWVGVNLTATSNNTFSGELDIEGTPNGSDDSQVTLPLATGAPTITSLTPNTGAVNSQIVIAGTNFRSLQNSSTVTFFNGKIATASAWSATSITGPVPSGATSGNVTVTVGGQVSSPVSFTVTPAPSITSLTPNTGAIGSSVVIAGSNFGPSQGNGSVKFNGTAATSNWSAGSITATVPTGATTGNVVVTAAGGVPSTGVSFTVTPAPNISSLNPNSGLVGSSVTINGSNFGAPQGNGSVAFNGTAATVITNWSATAVTATVPTAATTGNVVVTAAGGVPSNGVTFTVTIPPSITSLTPSSGEPGAAITIAGNNFTSTTGTVTFNGQSASNTNWTNTSITAVVPNGASSGNVVVTAGGLQSNGAAFTVLSPSIASLNPTSGSPGAAITIAGSNFGGSTGTVTFNGQSATVSSWADSSIVAVVPTGATSGNVVVSNGGLQSNGIPFWVLGQVFNGPVSYAYDELGRLVGAVAASGDAVQYSYDAVGNIVAITRYLSTREAIFSFSPKSGTTGTQVIISGANFSSNAAQDIVKFNGTTASISAASTTNLTVTVPAGATSGTISVTSPAGTVTSTSSFTVTASSGAPSITSFTPQIVSAGSTTTLAGTNFDTAPPNDHLVVNNTPAAVPTSVTSTSMVMTVPAVAGSGHVSLDTLGGGATTSAADLFVPPPGTPPSTVSSTGRTTFGTPTTVTMSTNNTVGLLLFEGKAGQNVSIQVSSATFTGCLAQVLKPDNTAMAAAACTGNTFIDAQTLPVSGTYALLINSSSGSGVFTILNASDFTASITPGGPPVTVTTTIAGQNGRLMFSGSKNQHVSLTLSNNTFTQCSISIMYPDNNRFLLSSMACANSNFIDLPYLQEVGTYVIKVDPSTTQTGTITVQLNDTTDITGPLTVGGNSITATTTVPGQNASYTFPGTLNQHVSISILSSTFSNCVIEVFKLDGTALVNGPPCNSTSTFYDVPLLPVAGTHRLIFDPQGTETGTITFKVNDATDITGTITTDGTPVTVTTTVPGQNAKLTFSGAAGQMISGILDNNTYAIGLNWSLLAPDGSTVASPTNGRGTLFMDDARYCQLAGGGQYLCGNITLPSAGTYTLFLDPATTDTGQVRARLFSVIDPTTAGTLNGPAVPLTIATPGQNGKIIFSGTQGGRVAVGFSSASFSGLVNPGFNFEILNPDGSLYAGPFNGGPFNFSTSNTSGFLDYNDAFLLPSTGTYTVVLDPTADTTGAASVNLYDATDLSMNINADGSANPVTTTEPGQNAHLIFSFTLGQRVSVLMTNIQYTHQPDLILRRVDTNGVLTNYQFSSPIGATRFIDGTTLADPGTYFLFFDPFSQETGSATATMYTVTDISGTLDTAGTPFTATTTTPGQNANLTFSGSSGQNVTLTVSSTDFAVNTCSLNVINPNGSQLFAVGCRSTGAPWSQLLQLPQTGTYTVVIDPTNANMGSLTVSITAQ